MYFSWTAEQRELIEKTLAFARTELNDGVNERDRAQQFGRSEWLKCGRFGLLGAPIATTYGGLGLNRLTTAAMFEAFGHGCLDGGLGMSAGAHTFACNVPMARFGSGPLRERWLPKLVSGEQIAGIAISEREAGSDAFSLKTRADRCGDRYRLFGEKTFVTNAPIADMLIVFASTDTSRGLLGVSAFVIERDRKGVTVGQRHQTLGLRTSPIGDVQFEDCVIPAANRLGAEGQGAAVFSVAMEWERSCLFAFWLGVMSRQLDETIAYANARVQFGRPIGSNQAVSHRIGNMKMRLETARLLLYRACWEADEGLSNPLHISLAKLAISEGAVQSSLDCIQIFGGLGIMCDTAIERYLRDVVAGTIYSGTSEMQRDLVATHLGLPRPHPGAVRRP